VSIYYQDDSVTLYHGDCLEVLPHVGSYDMVFTSPPYNKGPQSGGIANMRDGYDGYGDDLPDSDYVHWQQAVIAALWSGLADDGAIFYNHKPQIKDGRLISPVRLIPTGVNLRQIIIWNREFGANWSRSFFQPRHEWLMLLAKDEFVLRDKGASHAGDVWTIRPEMKEQGHPCPFPVGLPNIAISATDCTTVLDPFAGSGTTLRSAMDLGRKAIGIEKSEAYCEVIAKRLAQGVLL
jgi:site-specific DNA-methyltransferase (adenine-specific)